MTIDNKILDTLSEKEKEIALSILSELKNSGKSETLKDLKYADFKEIPVDIETFLTNDNYLGKPWKDVTGKSKNLSESYICLEIILLSAIKLTSNLIYNNT